jgi:large subunit ribosomal protein L24e
MAKCNFCSRQIEKGTGKIFVKKDGKILHFCSNRCEKNMLKLKRKASNLRWITSKKKKKAAKK